MNPRPKCELKASNNTVMRIMDQVSDRIAECYKTDKDREREKWNAEIDLKKKLKQNQRQQKKLPP